MMKRLLQTTFLLMFACLLQAQSYDAPMPPADLVATAHRAGQTFAPAGDLLRPTRGNSAARQARAAVLLDEVLLEFQVGRARQLLAQTPRTLAMELPLPGGGNATLELVQVDLFAEGFFLNTDQAPEGIAYTPGVHYRGVVRDQPGSMAALSVFENEVMGVFATPATGNFVLGRVDNARNPAEHVLYREADIIPTMPFDCSTPDEAMNELPLPTQHRGQSMPCIKVYLEVDSDIHNAQGGVVGATNWVTGLFNQSATIFAGEGINYEISQIFVWTGNSPYYISSPSTLLGIFQGRISNLNGDLGHLLTHRSSGGVAAGQNGLCNFNVDNSLCVSDVFNFYSTVPMYSWSVNVVTHEMGHLNGSPHTHSCSWNGDLTAIDGCSGFVHGTCPIPGNPPQGGTIMSYCHQTSVGMNFSLGFGPQPGARILGRALSANCLGACGGGPGIAGCDTTLDNSPYAESFESNFGVWTNDANDDFDWTRSFTTPTLNTGPNVAGDGFYFLYLESNGNYPTKRATLNGPCFDLRNTSSADFKFKSHLFGSSMGSLDLQASSDGGATWFTIWNRSGNHNNIWWNESVSLNSYLGDTVRLRFQGVTGLNQYSDMAIDALELVAVPVIVVPPVDPCNGVALLNQVANFELGDDLWVNVTGDDFNWTRQSDLLPFPGAWPDTASVGHYFRYADGGDNWDSKVGPYQNKVAYLEGPCYRPLAPSPSFFHFDYHMFESDIGSLALEISTDHGVSWSQLWYRNGEQSKKWLEDAVNLGPYNGDTVRLRFKVVTGPGPLGNIAVDHLEFNSVNPYFEEKLEAPEASIALYPNPAGAQVTLEVQWDGNGSAEDGQVQVQILDLMGRTLSELAWVETTGASRREISLEALAAGTYFVVVEVAGQRQVRRLVRE